MNDNEILARISELVTAEHQQRDRTHPHHSTGSQAESRAELATLEGTLDQCWDLLRQRRALREFGQDPDGASVRPRGQVQHYLQ